MQVLAPVSIILILLFYNYRYKNKMPYYVLTALVFTAIAFSFQPGKDDDLLREFSQLDSIRSNGWYYFSQLTTNIAGSYHSNRFQGLIVTQIYYFIMAHMPIKNFLPAITIFIDYYLQLKLLDKLQKRFDISKNDIILLFVFVICSRETYSMMSGIRNYLAFTIFGYALYTDLVEKKNRTLCFFVYIGTALIHQSGWMLFAIRLLCFIPWRSLREVICIAALLWGNFTGIIQTYVAKFSSIPLLNSLYVKIYNFTDSSSTYASLLNMGQRYFLYMLSNTGIIILSIYLYRVYIKQHNGNLVGEAGLRSENGIRLKNGKLSFHLKDTSKELSLNHYFDIFYFMILSLCVMFGSLPYRIVFSRIGIIIRVIDIVPIGIMLKHFSRTGQKSKKKELKILIIVACIIKFSIMMLFCNRSMHFNLFGWYYF